MCLHISFSRKSVLLLLLATAGLMGCVTPTAPLTGTQDAFPKHTVSVQVYRAADLSMSHYTSEKVQSALAGVRQTLQERGLDVEFQLESPVQVSESWEDLYSQDVLRLGDRFRHEADKRLRIIITNKIWSCGSNAAPTVILGCTSVGSPAVVVQGMVDGALDNYGTTDEILWLHEMGHSVQLGHADSWRRVMTPAPQPSSKQLEHYEVRQYGVLGESLRPVVVQSAIAAPAKMPTHLAPADLLADVRQAGMHGLDLARLRQLSDAQLAPLAQLLSRDELASTQANALAVLGQLGGSDNFALVLAYLRQRPASEHREIKEAGLIALAKNEKSEVAPLGTNFVIQATRPSFWCAPDASEFEQKACFRLSRMAIGALAQSQQPQARAYLQRLTEQSPSRRPQGIQTRPTGHMVIEPALPVVSSLDEKWVIDSQRTAQKFLSKATSQP